MLNTGILILLSNHKSNRSSDAGSVENAQAARPPRFAQQATTAIN